MDDLAAALQAASQYTPTSLEHGTKHFNLPPVDFLRSELFNWVDLEEKFKGAARNGLAEDKELMTLVDAEQVIQPVLTSDSKSSNKTAVKTAPATKKAARPEVTWLRRTEYISSLRPAAVASSAASQDEAKVALAEPVDFSQILAEVKRTFVDCAEAPAEHPFKAKVTLEQSFPVCFDEAQGLAHCLFLGDAGKRLQERSLLHARDLKDGSGTVATLLLPQSQDLSVYGSTEDHLEFDIQRTTEESSGKRNFVLMLPVEGANEECALLSSINATFALRKRRKSAVRQGRNKSLKQRLQVNRQ